MANFYIPDFDDPPSCLSGMVIALFGTYPVEPTNAFSYISKKEDIDMVHNLLKETVDWDKPMIFGTICDWHIPGLLELCKKQDAIVVHQVKVSEWQLPPSIEKEKSSKLQMISKFKSKSGHNLMIKQLDAPENPQFINENWKFNNSSSIHWIRSQCESGLAYGVFKTSDEGVGMVNSG